MKRILTAFLCACMIAVTASGCGYQDALSQQSSQTEATQATQTATEDEIKADNYDNNLDGLSNYFADKGYIVVDKEGSESSYTIKTDKKTVGEALIELEIIEGEDGPYGLFIKKVNGITADYDQDKTYWAFYIDGEYATTGADQTDIEEGVTYTLKVEK